MDKYTINSRVAIIGSVHKSVFMEEIEKSGFFGDPFFILFYLRIYIYRRERGAHFGWNSNALGSFR